MKKITENILSWCMNPEQCAVEQAINMYRDCKKMSQTHCIRSRHDVCNKTRPLWRKRIRARRGNCPQTQSPIGRGVKNFINSSNNRG